MRPRIPRKLLVASLGVASVAYSACDKPAAAPTIDVGTLDAGRLEPLPSAAVADAPPAADAGAPAPGPTTSGVVTLLVDVQGKVALDGAALTDDELKTRLRAAKAGGAPFVRIVPDRQTPYSAVVRVLDIVQKEGLETTLGPPPPRRPDAPAGNLMPPP